MIHKLSRLSIAATAACLLTAPLGWTTARADDRAGCTGFFWPLDAELELMAGPAETVTNGVLVPGLLDKTVEVTLLPTASTTLPFKPGIKPKAIPPSSFSGWIEIANVPAAGIYQIIINHNGWIDAAQDGVVLESAGFTGSPNCKILHKSVRYQLAAGPMTLQLTGVPAEKVKVTFRRATQRSD